jgi:Protein of unknown function (DUF3761)
MRRRSIGAVMGPLAVVAAVLVSGAPAARADTPPPGATARCRDGTYSFSQHHQGTCSHHGGVAEWLDASGSSSAPSAPSQSSGGSSTSGSLATAARLSFPTATSAHYAERTAVKVIANPPSGLAYGRRVAASASYRDHGAGAPSALVSLYVYSTAANAQAAFEASCPASGCSKSSAAAKLKIALRFRMKPTKVGHCIRLSSLHENILVFVDTCAVRDDKGEPYSIGKLKYDAAFLVGAVQGRARPRF